MPDNPGWYALALSLLSIAVSTWALYHARTSAAASVDHSFVQQRNDINKAIMRHSLKGPFATILNIPDNELETFVPKVGVLFLHLNLLEDVYQNKHMVNKRRMASYERWAKNIITPWVMSDKHLQAVIKLVYHSNDLMDKKCVDWLKQMISIC